MKYRLTNEEKLEEYFKAVRMRLEGATREEIIKSTRFPSWRVLDFFMLQNNLTLPLDRAAFNKNVDVTFFDKIDTDYKAYILGFIYSDGCIYDNGRFGFCITQDDSEILSFIKEKMKITGEIKTVHNIKGSRNRRPQSILRISSVKLVTKLREKFGVTQNKTLREGLLFPKMEDELINSFLRGVSDGDGNLYFKSESGSKKNSKFRWSLCMSDKAFLTEVKSYLESKGINLSLHEKQGKTCKFYILCTNSRLHTEKLCELLYQSDGYCLQRKKNKYLSYKKLDNTVLS